MTNLSRMQYRRHACNIAECTWDIPTRDQKWYRCKLHLPCGQLPDASGFYNPAWVFATSPLLNPSSFHDKLSNSYKCNIYIHHILLYSHIYRDVVQCCTLSRGANNMHVYILCAHTTVLSTSISASVYVYIHYMTTGIAACSSLQILYFIGFDPYPYTYIYKNTTDIHKI